MNNCLNLKRKLLLLLFWTILVTGSKAQPNLAFYPFEDQYNSFDYNPAFLTSREKYTFSVFPIGGSSIGYNNQKIIQDLSSKFLKGVITNQDYKNVFSDMVTQSAFHQNAETSLFSFTYHSDIGFFNFRIKDSQYFMASVEGQTTQFIFKSDIQSAVIDQIQYLPSQAAHYREYSLGYSYKSPSNRFWAGIRAKLYYGKFAFFSNISGSIQEDAQNPANYVLRTAGLINISFPENTILNPNDSTNTIEFDSSNILKYLFNNDNKGLGVDLGINYQIAPGLMFSMSIIDLGKINWKSNLNSRTMDEAKYPLSKSNEITEVDGIKIIKKGDGFAYSDLFDFSVLPRERSPFSKALPATFYTGLKYQLNPHLSLSLTDRYIIVKDLNYNSFSLAANFDVGSRMTISSGFSAIADDYFNVPLAFLFRGDIGQFYVGTDNLTSFLLPSAAEFAGISFGACFYLFPKRNLYLKTSDHTPFYKPRKTIKNRRSGLIIPAEPYK